MTDTATLAGLDPTTLGDLLRVAGAPGFDRWQDQIRRTGGCSDPIHLTGSTKTLDPTTGTVLHTYSTDAEPGGRAPHRLRQPPRLPLPLLRLDLRRRHLPPHPRRPHRRPSQRHPAHRPRPPPRLRHPHRPLLRPRPQPPHQPVAAAAACTTPMAPPSWELPLNPDTYDYAGAVLWNNHASTCGATSRSTCRREIAKRAGLTQNAPQEQLRVSFGKVAEYQKRGAVHFHAVIRFDGPDGPDTAPPPWATLDLLTDAIRAAAARAEVSLPPTGDQPARTLRWGTQLDVQPIGAFGNGEDLTEQAVASYVAKYATKAAETTGTVDRRIGNIAELDKLPDLPDHPRRLIAACWDLDALYPDRRLWHWAHMLGFRGHFSTKSRRYSTTLGALRQVRADYRAAQQRAALGLPDPDDNPEATTLTLAHWAYAGHGHTPGESWLAANIARDIQTNRDTARQARAELDEEGEW